MSRNRGSLDRPPHNRPPSGFPWRWRARPPTGSGENGYRLVIAKVRDLRVDDHGEPQSPTPGENAPQELPADDALVVVRHDQTARGLHLVEDLPAKALEPGALQNSVALLVHANGPAGSGRSRVFTVVTLVRSSTRQERMPVSDSAARTCSAAASHPPHPRSWARHRASAGLAARSPPRRGGRFLSGRGPRERALREIRSTSPQMKRSSMTSPTTRIRCPWNPRTSSAGAAGLHQAETPSRGGLASPPRASLGSRRGPGRSARRRHTQTLTRPRSRGSPEHADR